MKYAERIRALREDHDKTQSEITKLLKVGQRTYCDYELGKTRIPVDTRLARRRIHGLMNVPGTGMGISPFLLQ